MLDQINDQLQELESLRHSVEDTQYLEYWSVLYTQAYLLKLVLTK